MVYLNQGNMVCLHQIGQLYTYCLHSLWDAPRTHCLTTK
jgi:hypothetical protein